MPAMEGAMPNENLWNRSLPRVELDHRAREARLRLERLERLLVPRAAATGAWLRRALCLFGARSNSEGTRGLRIRGKLSNRRPGRMPEIYPGWGPSAA
jgi:hypothetical protein